MIGYYVHHHGTGHLNRALEVAQVLDQPVTGLSSLPAPSDWPGEWLQLSRDDVGGPAQDPTARGRLHWTPMLDAGLAARWHQMSEWIATRRPSGLVVDVSVEATLLARLHGIPVVGVVLPGRRTDPAHLFAFDICDELVGAWPPSATDMLPSLPRHVADRVRPIGALSRHPVRTESERRPGPPRVVVMTGAGGHDLSGDRLDGARRETPGWDWTILSRELGTWVADPRAVIEDADVVVTHAGQGAIAEVAAARRPAIVIPQERPFDEQVTTAALLRQGWPALVEDEFPVGGWETRLRHASALDGGQWARWCDGHASERFAEIIGRVASVGVPA